MRMRKVARGGRDERCRRRQLRTRGPHREAYSNEGRKHEASMYRAKRPCINIALYPSCIPHIKNTWPSG